VLLGGMRLLAPASVFVAVEGTNSGNIRITGSDLSKADKAVKVDRGARRKMVQVRP